VLPSRIQQSLVEQEWIDPFAGAVQDAVGKALEGEVGERVADVLHGTWLGHPLHPVLTDLPIGAWTTAAALDALEAAGRDELAPGADAAIGLGLVGAVATAVTGLVDWQRVGKGKNRRLGTFHMIANVAATAVYAGSLVARRTGNRGLGRTLGWLGFGLMSAGGWLGGALVYDRRIGVDHGQREDLPAKWTAVLAAAELGDGELRRVEAGAARVLLHRHGDEIRAIGEVCSHLGGPLAEGDLDEENECVTCPWHGSVFSLATGEVVHGPAVLPVPRFETRVRGGQIEVRVVDPGV